MYGVDALLLVEFLHPIAVHGEKYGFSIQNHGRSMRDLLQITSPFINARLGLQTRTTYSRQHADAEQSENLLDESLS